MQDKVFDKSIRDKLQSFEPKVPTGLWTNIAAGLEEKPVVPLKRRNNRFFWIRIAAAVIIFIGMAMFYINRPREIIYLTVSNKQGNKEVIMPESQSIELAPLLNEKVQEMKQPKVVKSFTSERTKNDGQTAPAMSFVQEEEQDVSAPMPVFKHPTLEEEVKRTAFTMPHPAVREEQLLPTFVDETPDLLAVKASTKDKKRFGAADLLNYVVKSVDQRDEKLLSFANDEEGTIKVAVNLKALKIKL